MSSPAASNNNDAKLVETGTVHLANLKFSYHFESVNGEID